MLPIRAKAVARTMPKRFPLLLTAARERTVSGKEGTPLLSARRVTIRGPLFLVIESRKRRN